MGAIAIIPIAAAVSLLFRRRIEDTMAVAMFFVVTILYVPGLFGSYLPGLYVCYAMILLSLGYAGYVFIKDRTRFSSFVLTTGLFAYLLFLVYFFLVSYRRDVFIGDDLHRWAAAVRDFYREKHFFNTPDGWDTAYVYPPMLPIWNVFSVELSGHFDEWIIFYAHNMLTGILSLPLFRHIQGRTPRRNALLLFVAIITIQFITGITCPYGNLHDSIPHGLLAAFIIFRYYDYTQSGSRFDLISSIWAAFILVMIKEIAFSTAAISVFVIFVYELSRPGRRQRIPKLTGVMFLYAASMAASVASWQYYLLEPVRAKEAEEATVGLVASISLSAAMLSTAPPSSRFVAVFKALVSGVQNYSIFKETLFNYFYMLFHPEDGSLSGTGVLRLSAPALLLLLCMFTVAIFRASPDGTASRVQPIRRLTCMVILIGAPAGFLVRGIVYGRAPSNLGFIYGTHMSAYPAMALLFFLYYLLHLASKKQTVYLSVTLLLFFLLMNPLHLITSVWDKPQNTILSCAEEAGITFTEEDYVFRLNDSTAGFGTEDHDFVHYYSYPAKNNLSPAYFFLSQDTDGTAYVRSLLSQYGATYLYVGGISPAIRSLVFDDIPGGHLQDYSLYRVTQSAEGVAQLSFLGRDVPNAFSYLVERYPTDRY